MKRKKKAEPSPRRPGFGVRWSDDEREAIDETADDKGVKATQVIRLAVKEYIDAHRRSKDAKSQG